MSELPATPLEPLAPEPASRNRGPMVLLKREDLLPYGGGNKIRRLLAWINELKCSRNTSTAGGNLQTIAVLSYRGAHTFLALTELLRQDMLPCRSLLFWEWNRPATPYTEQIRRRYADQPGVTVAGGSPLGLLGRMGWTRCVGRGKVVVLGIGGAVSPRSQPHRVALDECVQQLSSLGRTDSRIWHLLPAASGTMLGGLARAIRETGCQNHRLIGVQTGPPISRWLLSWKCRGRSDVVLVRPQPLAWPSYLVAATRFYERTGIWLDPTHAIYAAQMLDRLPTDVRSEDVVVCWITCPRMPPLNGGSIAAQPIET